MKYLPIPYTPLVDIRCLHTFLYFQFEFGYVFKGESHPFWEIVYVDNGEVYVGADENMVFLRTGDMFFHHPDQMHTLWATREATPDVLIISFSCESTSMDYFRNKLQHLDERQRGLMRQILLEGQEVFEQPLDVHNMPKATSKPGSLQAVKIYLELLLLSFLRQAEERTRVATPMQPKEHILLNTLQDIMHQHMDGSLQFPDICRQVLMSGTSLKRAFRQLTGIGVMQYYERIRLAEACRLLRQGDRSIAFIANTMGYSSPQHFALRFKKVLGLSPTEYKNRVHQPQPASGIHPQ